MDKQKIRNYVGQILEKTHKIRHQAPINRHATSKEIDVIARRIKNEIDPMEKVA